MAYYVLVAGDTGGAEVETFVYMGVFTEKSMIVSVSILVRSMYDNDTTAPRARDYRIKRARTKKTPGWLVRGSEC